MKYYYFYLFLAVLSVLNTATGFRVLYPPKFANKTYNSPWIPNFYDNVSTDEPIVARLAGTWTDKPGPWEGAIVLACIVDSGRFDTV
jgi:hypothetical protein